MLLRASIGFTVAPTAGGLVEFWAGFSSLSTAASGNPANLSGADAAYTGYINDCDQAKNQLWFVGAISVSINTQTPAAQTSDVGVFVPLDRYMMVVACNRASQVLTTITTTQAVTVIPLMDEAQ
jgi:hypothetical protein